MANEPISELLLEVGKELLLESAKALPRTEYGLSKYFSILRHENQFQANLDVPIVEVTQQTVKDFVKFLTNCYQQQTLIGFDSETYESIIHKEVRSYKKDKNNVEIKDENWYWYNEHTKKYQKFKPALNQNQNLIRLLQFSDGDKTYVIDLGRCDAPALPIWLGEAWSALEKLAEANVFVGHNLKFDTSSVRKYGLIIKNPYCTMITAQLVFGDCGAGKVLANGNSLQSVSHNLLDLKLDKSLANSNWGAEHLSKEQIWYGANDAVVPLITKKLLELMLENPEQWGLKEFAGKDGKHANLPLVTLENKNIYHTTEMQYRGVPCDLAELQKCIEGLKLVRAEIEQDWDYLQMPCTPQQAKKITEELNKRYIQREHPFDPQAMADALGVELDEDSKLQLPVVDEPFTSTAKDAINDNEDIPELQVLKAWRAFNTAIVQLSAVEISVKINDGVCRTEYKPMSGTGRMACGSEDGLGTPNLQAFIKKAEGKFFGYMQNVDGTPTKFWSKPNVCKTIKIRKLFKLSNQNLAFFTEDANASHMRLAFGFGKCEFGKLILEDDKMDAHSMFAMMALQAMLAEDATCLDSFPKIRDFVKDLTESEIRTADITAKFKALDKEKPSDERFRSAAKTLFYSVLNGAQADKMRKVLSSSVGRSVSVTAGTAMFDAFWNLYTGVGAYIKRILLEAEANSVNYGGIEFNITTLPDGTKLAYARKDGELAVTNIIACQWSRSEATALKRIMAAIPKMPEEWGTSLVNMVHDEVGIICAREHWQEAYSFTSDLFAKEYDVYLQGFIPGDEPTEKKLFTKEHELIPVLKLDDHNQRIYKEGEIQVTNLSPATQQYSAKVGVTVLSAKIENKVEVTTCEVVISHERYGSYWSTPTKPYVPTSWADK